VCLCVCGVWCVCVCVCVCVCANQCCPSNHNFFLRILFYFCLPFYVKISSSSSLLPRLHTRTSSNCPTLDCVSPHNLKSPPASKTKSSAWRYIIFSVCVVDSGGKGSYWTHVVCPLTDLGSYWIVQSQLCTYVL